MALLFMQGFDFYYGINSSALLDDPRTAETYFNDINDAGPAVSVTTNHITGGRIPYIDADGSRKVGFRNDEGFIRWTPLRGQVFGSAGTTIVTGFHFLPQYDGTNSVIGAWGIQNQDNEAIQFYVRGSRQHIEVYLNNTTTLLGYLPGAALGYRWHWYEVEMFVDASIGWVRVYQDGIRKIQASALDTALYAPYDHMGFSVQRTANIIHYYFDNVYMLDDTSPGPTSRLGEVRIKTFYPRSDASPSDWALSSGAVSYPLINTISGPNFDDDGYIYTSVVGTTDMWQVEASTLDADDIIHGVQTIVRARKTDAGNVGISQIISGAASTARVSATAQAPINTNYTYMTDIWQTPNASTTTNWSVGAISAMQFGIVMVSTL